MTKSIDKGKGYELRVAKALTKWAGFKLIRTPQSGAWQGTAGDIIPQNRERSFEWLIECKKEEGWTLEAIIVGQCAKFNDWIEQVWREVKTDYEITNMRRFPVVIFSRNYKPDFIALPVSYITLLGADIVIPTFTKLELPKFSGVIIPLDDFIRFNRFSNFEAFVAKYIYSSAYVNIVNDI